MRNLVCAGLAAAAMMIALPEASSAAGACAPGQVCAHQRGSTHSFAPRAAQPQNYGGGYGRGYRGNRGYDGDGGYGDVGAGIAGLAAGALIGGVIANQTYYGEVGGDDGYCVRTYRSYDPASGTYLGYDGFRHPCP